MSSGRHNSLASRPIALFLTHSSPGGLLEIWNDLASGLSPTRVDKFALYPGTLGKAEAEAAGWQHIAAQRPRGPLAAAALLSALSRAVRSGQYGAVITAMPLANVILPLVIQTSRLSTKVITSHHSPINTHRRALSAMDSWTARLPSVAAVVSVSHAVAASLASKSDSYRRKSVVIPNALSRQIESEIDRIVRAREPSRAAEHADFPIVAVGRLSYQKNYPQLLKALAAVDGASLTIVGTGEDEDQLRAMAAELGIASRVDFAGQMTREGAIGTAAAAAAFVQVSRYEGHSLALIEAARLALPLIVSDIPEQVEAVTGADDQPCAEVVALDDAAGLATVLKALRDAPERRRSLALRARACGLAASNDRMIARYRELIGPHPIPADPQC